MTVCYVGLPNAIAMLARKYSMLLEWHEWKIQLVKST